MHDFIQFFLLQFFYTFPCSLSTDDKVTAQQSNGIAYVLNKFEYKSNTKAKFTDQSDPKFRRQVQFTIISSPFYKMQS